MYSSRVVSSIMIVGYTFYVGLIHIVIMIIGEDISVCVCLAILISLFNEEGNGILYFLVFFRFHNTRLNRNLNHLQGILMVENPLKKRVLQKWKCDEC